MSPRTHLTAMPPKPKPVPTHDGYQEAGTRNRPEIVLSPETTAVIVRHVARHAVPSFAALRPARFLIIQGEPGTGKTETVRVVLSRNGIDCIVVSASELAGEAEDAAPSALRALAEAATAYTAKTGRPIAIVIDDADLSIVARLKDTTYTVDSQLLGQYLQFIADNPSEIVTAGGMPIPFICTGNDYTPLRASTFRPGRAEFHTHAPSFDDKVSIVAAMFGTDAKAIRALVKQYRNEPIAFFAQIRCHLRDADLDTLVAHYGFQPDAIERELASLAPRLDLAAVAAIAARLATRRATNFFAR